MFEIVIKKDTNITYIIEIRKKKNNNSVKGRYTKEVSRFVLELVGRMVVSIPTTI